MPSDEGNTGRQQRLADAGGSGTGGAKGRTDEAGRRTPMTAAEDFVHLYVDDPRWLRIFLMYVLREGGRAGPAVADTLLELLLREWAKAPGGKGRGGSGGAGLEAVKKQREAEVMALLDNPRAGFDVDHALVLVQMLNFKPGQLYLYEKVRFYSMFCFDNVRVVAGRVGERGRWEAVREVRAGGSCCCLHYPRVSFGNVVS